MILGAEVQNHVRAHPLAEPMGKERFMQEKCEYTIIRGHTSVGTENVNLLAICRLHNCPRTFHGRRKLVTC